MPFADFHGNAETVRIAREMLARGHFPHAVILSNRRAQANSLWRRCWPRQ